MKNIIGLIILVTYCFSCSDSVLKDNDLLKENLGGKVKSVVTKSYKAIDKFGEITKGASVYDREYYDPIEDQYLNTKLVYNEMGNLLENNMFYGEEFIAKQIIKYDENDKVSSLNLYDSEGDIDSKVVNMYDENGNLSELKTFDSKGNLEKTIVYKYGDSNRKVEANIILPISDYIEKHYFKYKINEKGDIVLQERYIDMSDFNKDTPMLLLDSIAFVNKKNTETKLFRSHVVINQKDQSNTVFSTLKEVYKRKFNDNNDLTEIDKRTYDEMKIEDLGYLPDELIGLTDEELSQVVITTSNDTKHVFNYKYDKNRNWIEKTVYENNIPIIIIEREIEYY